MKRLDSILARLLILGLGLFVLAGFHVYYTQPVNSKGFLLLMILFAGLVMGLILTVHTTRENP